jgi:MFS family permease
MAKSSTSLVTGVTFVATLGGLLFGYDTAVISGAVSSIDANFIDPQHLSETARSSLSGWTVSSALFGCIIGALIAGWVSNAIGRKGGMMVAGALVSGSAAGSAYPEFGLGPIGGMGPQALVPPSFCIASCAASASASPRCCRRSTSRRSRPARFAAGWFRSTNCPSCWASCWCTS